MLGRTMIALLCALVLVVQVSPNPLTKEITLDDARQAAVVNALEEVGSNSLATLLAFTFKSPEAVVSNLAKLVTTKSAEVSEVVDVFNAGFGERVLVLKEDSVQVEVDALQRYLSDRSRVAIQYIYPNDVLKQFTAYLAVQTQLKEALNGVRSQIEANDIPVQRLQAVLNPELQRVAMRADDNIFEQIIATVLLETCNTVSELFFAQINIVLNNTETYLDTITVSGDTILTSIVDVAIDFLTSAIEAIRTQLSDLSSSLCSNLLGVNSTTSSTRKRREIAFEENDLDLVRANPDAQSLQRTDVALINILSGLLDVIGGFIASILNPVLKALVSYLLSSITSALEGLLDDSVGTFLNDLIDSIFPISSS